MRCIYRNDIGTIKEKSNEALFNLQTPHDKDLAEVCTVIGDIHVVMQSSL